MSLIPHATSPFLVHQTPQTDRVSRSPRSVRPCQQMRQTVLPLHLSCALSLATLNMRDRRLTFLNHIPLHPVLYTSPRSLSCQCCGAWCCDLVSRTFFRPHYHSYPTPRSSSPSSSSTLPHANADQPFTGAYRCPSHRTLIFLLIAVPANTLAHANTFGVPA